MSNLRFAAWYNLFLSAMAALALILRCDPIWAVAFVLLWAIVAGYLALEVHRLDQLLRHPKPLGPTRVHAIDPFRDGLTVCGLDLSAVTHYRTVEPIELPHNRITCPACRRRIANYGP